MKRKFTCQFCAARFTSRRHWSSHQADCDQLNPMVQKVENPSCAVDLSRLDTLCVRLERCDYLLSSENTLPLREDVKVDNSLSELETQFKCESCHKKNCTRHGNSFYDDDKTSESLSNSQCENLTKEDFLKLHSLKCISQEESSADEEGLESVEDGLGFEEHPETFKCRNCIAVFIYETDCTRHEKCCALKNSFVARFSCSHCKRTYVRKENFRRHLLKCKSSTPETLNQEEMKVEELITDVDDQFECNNYEASIEEDDNFARPEELCNDSDSIYICHVCGQLFDRKNGFEEHLKKCGVTFKCQGCPATFTSKNNCTRHQKICMSLDSETVRFICHICGKDFNRKDALKCHLLRCEGKSHENPFKCKTCSVTFTLRRNRARHEKYCKANESAETFSCPICFTSLSRKDSLKAHLRRCTILFAPKSTSTNPGPERSEPEALKETPFKCKNCSATFTVQDDYARHELSCKDPNPTFGGLICEKDLERNENLNHLDTSTAFQCEYCEFKCRHKLIMIRHARKCSYRPTNNTTLSGKPRTPCLVNGCKLNFYLRTSLMRHLKKAHKDVIVFKGTVRKEFPSFQEFIAWKEAEEASSMAHFLKRNGTISKFAHYYCQYDGFKREFSQNKIMRNSSRGRKVKSGNYCMARMKVSNFNDKVQVEYFPTHSHPCGPQDIIHHPVPQNILEFINDRLDKDVPPSVIYSQINQNYAKENSNSARLSAHISKKAILEKARKHRKNQRLHSDDAKSIHFLVEEKKEDNSVLLYKPNSERVIVGPEEINHLPNAEELFLFGMQTQRQLELMQIYGTKVLVVDETDGTNHFGYKLLSCLAVDEERRGWPVAHLITSRSDSETLKYFFAALKSRLGDKNPTCVITDDDSAITVEAMNKGFGTNLRHLLCQWQVMKNLLENMKRTVHKVLHEEVHDDLKAIMSETNEIRFYSLLGEFVRKYQNQKKSHGFVEFIDEKYRKMPEKWATCHRNFDHCGINTIVYAKSFHTRLKQSHLNTRVKRLDDLVIALYRVEWDDHTSRLKEQSEGFLTLPQPISDRHRRGLEIKDKAVIRLLDNVFEILPRSGKNKTTVIKYERVCNTGLCLWRCTNERCNDLCSHLYSCSCGDRHPLCEHIHKIHSHTTKDTLDSDLEEALDDVSLIMHSPQSYLDESSDEGSLTIDWNEEPHLDSDGQEPTADVEETYDDGSLLEHFPQIVEQDPHLYRNLLEPIEGRAGTTPTTPRKRRLPKNSTTSGEERKKSKVDYNEALSTNVKKGLMATEIPENESIYETNHKNQINSTTTTPTRDLPTVPSEDTEEVSKPIIKQKVNITEATSESEIKKKQLLLEKIETHIKALKDFHSSTDLASVPDQFVAVLESSLSGVVGMIEGDDEKIKTES